jgi:hypothetical protein
MKPALPQSPGSSKLNLLLLVILLVLLGATYLYLQGYLTSGSQPLMVESLFRSKKSEPTPSPSPQPQTIVKLPEGKQVYRFSHGQDVVGPKPASITIDPLTPQTGQTQTVTIAVDADTPAETVTVEVISDNKTVPHQLKLKNEVWQGSWTIDDSYDQKYGLHLILAGAENYDEIMWLKNQP